MCNNNFYQVKIPRGGGWEGGIFLPSIVEHLAFIIYFLDVMYITGNRGTVCEHMQEE